MCVGVGGVGVGGVCVCVGVCHMCVCLHEDVRNIDCVSARVCVSSMLKTNNINP